jgi:hypothetical protein
MTYCSPPLLEINNSIIVNRYFFVNFENNLTRQSMNIEKFIPTVYGIIQG